MGKRDFQKEGGKMGKNREKYFRCPECGALETKTGMLKSVGNGSLGMCYCKFDNSPRILTAFEEITKKEYEARLLERVE